MFDISGEKDLPACDILLAADVLYSSKLAFEVGNRILEALRRSKPPRVLVTDSQRFQGTDFVPQLQEKLQDNSFGWEESMLEEFTGSGVLVDEDQTYDVKVRKLAINWI